MVPLPLTSSSIQMTDTPTGSLVKQDATYSSASDDDVIIVEMDNKPKNIIDVSSSSENENATTNEVENTIHKFNEYCAKSNLKKGVIPVRPATSRRKYVSIKPKPFSSFELGKSNGLHIVQPTQNSVVINPPVSSSHNIVIVNNTKFISPNISSTFRTADNGNFKMYSSNSSHNYIQDADKILDEPRRPIAFIDMSTAVPIKNTPIVISDNDLSESLPESVCDIALKSTIGVRPPKKKNTARKSTSKPNQLARKSTYRKSILDTSNNFNTGIQNECRDKNSGLSQIILQNHSAEVNEPQNEEHSSNDSVASSNKSNYLLDDDYYGPDAMNDNFIKSYYETLRQNQLARNAIEKTSSDMKRKSIEDESNVVSTNTKISRLEVSKDLENQLLPDSDNNDMFESVRNAVGDLTTSEVNSLKNINFDNILKSSRKKVNDSSDSVAKVPSIKFPRLLPTCFKPICNMSIKCEPEWNQKNIISTKRKPGRPKKVKKEQDDNKLTYNPKYKSTINQINQFTSESVSSINIVNNDSHVADQESIDLFSFYESQLFNDFPNTSSSKTQEKHDPDYSPISSKLTKITNKHNSPKRKYNSSDSRDSFSSTSSYDAPLSSLIQKVEKRGRKKKEKRPVGRPRKLKQKHIKSIFSRESFSSDDEVPLNCITDSSETNSATTIDKNDDILNSDEDIPLISLTKQQDEDEGNKKIRCSNDDDNVPLLFTKSDTDKVNDTKHN